MAWENLMAVVMILAEKVGGSICLFWGRMSHIHPQQHSSGWDHNQSCPTPNSPVRQMAKNSVINDPLLTG
jgi:hypothetical protein